MRKPFPAFLCCLLLPFTLKAQSLHLFADSIRTACHIPALGYAVVSADSILEIQMLGNKKINTPSPATLQDQFRIGSNTKAITCTMAALLVQQNKLHWNTPFFSLFPDLKTQSHPAYYHLTLKELLTFRNKLVRYTYTNPLPRPENITGNEAAQRRQFATWLLQQPPVSDTNAINYTNSGYVLAGLMLEKAAHKSYLQLLQQLGQQLGIHFGLGGPNAVDSTQPWGHDHQLQPEAPANNPKLNWLQAAGNIHISLQDYARFIQFQLRGLAGRSPLLPATIFEQLHYGHPTFAYGWFWKTNNKGEHISWNTGTPGTFVTHVQLVREQDRAYIVFTNVQQDNTEEAVEAVVKAMEKKYGQ
ncbi:serine hydrolase domain-containing protein [Chitinophaga flava]|uniref:Beta-lactamase-related domain-containing protein n=1 Tax=Chitinophaga flava TaxID=2259036 RepID=A0A365Y0X8_9BACT|nr:serine hydrolase domain-containing protein [Chitinophaga flava]RBL91495.1 hypothetical protein DF182_02465 [Chitinophaga flava]